MRYIFNLKITTELYEINLHKNLRGISFLSFNERSFKKASVFCLLMREVLKASRLHKTKEKKRKTVVRLETK